jgi:hypothetical protein
MATAATETTELPICFVIMGFHIKPALDRDQKVRLLDLDKSYESLIKPAVKAAGMRCVRADEVLQSGLIDRPMYEMLLSADLVIADISAGNVNAVYELGVRHALRPQRTILLLEDQAGFSFDLSHLSTFTYRHLGEDLPLNATPERRKQLTALIRQVNSKEAVDSPVYSFLDFLAPRVISPADRDRMIRILEGEGDRLARLLTSCRGRIQADDFSGAIALLQEAKQLIEALNDEERKQNQANYDFVLQQLALATYKSKTPDKVAALQAGLQIISQLRPDQSNDTETLGIAGAIRKRLWDEGHQRAHLDKAVEYYGRGFSLKSDYYNGENYATCLVSRAALQEDEEDRTYDLLTAKKTRKEIVDILSAQLESDGPFSGADAIWRYATLANCLFALRRDQEALPHEKTFLSLAPADWQRETYENGKARVLAERV